MAPVLFAGSCDIHRNTVRHWSLLLRRIVLHVGPGKCGSSTIQSAVLSKSSEISKHVNGILLEPAEVSLLNSPNPPPETIAYFREVIRNALSASPEKVLVLSHEVLFKFVDALVNLAGIARDHADEVVVVGYVRRQSDFLVSSFRQWLFRAPDRIAETADVLRENGLDPSVFLGVERHLIAAMFGNWHTGRQLSGHLFFDWSESLAQRAKALEIHRVPLSIGVLPRAGFEKPLVQDFLERIGVKPGEEPVEIAPTNEGYHGGLIEAVLNAIEVGHKMPGPHDFNDFFGGFRDLEGLAPKLDVSFLARLKTHIDTVFLAKNTEVAQKFGFDPDYFKPNALIDRQTIHSEIKAEEAKRAVVPKEIRARETLARAEFARNSWAEFQARGG